jgi:reductive dehalogenase
MRLPPEVDRPTYEIVGKVERWDRRDSLLARLALIPGSPEYNDYYTRRPELKEADDEERKRQASVKKKVEPINVLFTPSTFYGLRILAARSVVEGKVADKQLVPLGRVGGGVDAGRKVELGNRDPEEMAKKIKSFAMYLGAMKVRIGKLKQEWVFTYDSVEGAYSEPVELNYENLICMAFPQNPEMIKSRAADFEVSWKYSCSALASTTVAEFIRRCGWRARALCRTNAPYSVIAAMVDTGMGEQGRHSMLITKEFGSWFILAAVATDMPLPSDKPVDFGLQDFCEKCTICAEICPQGAIPFGGKQVIRGVRRWHIDADKCRLSREKMGRACALCKIVCPWSHANNWLHNNIRELSQSCPSLRKLLIKAEKVFYGKAKLHPVPDWIGI